MDQPADCKWLSHSLSSKIRLTYTTAQWLSCKELILRKAQYPSSYTHSFGSSWVSVPQGATRVTLYYLCDLDVLFLLTLVGRDNDGADRFYLCWVCLCGILRLEPECQIGEKICIYIEIETSVFGMRASALLQPGCESTWALLSVSAQCVCMWRGGVIKTSDAPHLMGLCWNLGWILL